MSREVGVRVRKRDGSHEPFQMAKLRRSIAIAMRSCRVDERFADSLARAVTVHMEQNAAGRPPTTDYVFRCVRAVLSETGLEEIARQLIVHRRTRAARRRSVVIQNHRRGGQLEAWSKSVICQTLQRKHGLERGTARMLSGEIEQRVLGLHYGVVSTNLVSELIRGELLAWGLAESQLSTHSA